MGIHISIVNIQTEEELSQSIWDIGRYYGDREIPNILEESGCRTIQINDDIYHRPIDLDKFQDDLVGKYPENEERWKLLRELLSKNENRYLYYSL